MSASYSQNFKSQDQLEAEEKIAAMIFDHDYGDNERPDEESCARLGRDILRVILEKFRPDLFTNKNEHISFSLNKQEAANLIGLLIIGLLTDNWNKVEEL